MTLRVRGLQVVSVALLLLVWEAAARAGWVDPLFIPAPSAVARAFGGVGGVALGGLADTLAKTAVAYVLSVVLGVGGGVLLGSLPAARRVELGNRGTHRGRVDPKKATVVAAAFAPDAVQSTSHRHRRRRTTEFPLGLK